MFLSFSNIPSLLTFSFFHHSLMSDADHLDRCSNITGFLSPPTRELTQINTRSSPTDLGSNLTLPSHGFGLLLLSN